MPKQPYPRGDPDPWKKLSKGEKKQINKLLYPKPMSIWDKVPQDDNSGGRYVSLKDGDSITLKFIDLRQEEQPEEAKYPSDDGMHWVFEFEDKEGNEKLITCNDTGRAFFIGMREAGEPEPPCILHIRRTGESSQTRYHVEEVDSFDEVPAPPKEEDKDEIPFA